MKKNIESQPYESTFIDMWDFSWPIFQSEQYEDDQEFLVILTSGDRLIIDYDDFQDNVSICSKGVSHYLPINIRGEK